MRDPVKAADPVWKKVRQPGAQSGEEGTGMRRYGHEKVRAREGTGTFLSVWNVSTYRLYLKNHAIIQSAAWMLVVRICCCEGLERLCGLSGTPLFELVFTYVWISLRLLGVLTWTYYSLLYFLVLPFFCNFLTLSFFPLLWSPAPPWCISPVLSDSYLLCSSTVFKTVLFCLSYEDKIPASALFIRVPLTQATVSWWHERITHKITTLDGCTFVQLDLPWKKTSPCYITGVKCVCVSNCAKEQPLSVIPNQMLALAAWLDEDVVGVSGQCWCSALRGQFTKEALLFPK